MNWDTKKRIGFIIYCVSDNYQPDEKLFSTFEEALLIARHYAAKPGYGTIAIGLCCDDDGLCTVLGSPVAMVNEGGDVVRYEKV